MTNKGNVIASIYYELIHNTGKRKVQEIVDILNDFEEEEEFDVKAITFSRNEVDNRFFTVKSINVITTGPEYYFGFQSGL